MAEKTIIAWTDHTWNLAWGCTKISPGCTNCYADGIADRYGWDVWGPKKDRRTFGENHWKEPLKWNRQAQSEGRQHRVFCSSMCDNFEDHPSIVSQLPRLWDLIRRTPYLDWQLLTKRADRIEESLPEDWGIGWPNVWLGVSIENNDYVWRANCLQSVSAIVHFISYEPALGPVDRLSLDGIQWVIVGGESGPKFRRMDLAWARDIQQRCKEAGVAFFFKQSSHRFTERGIDALGAIYREYPQTAVIGIE